jgi:hypothetical protein
MVARTVLIVRNVKRERRMEGGKKCESTMKLEKDRKK